MKRELNSWTCWGEKISDFFSWLPYEPLTHTASYQDVITHTVNKLKKIETCQDKEVCSAVDMRETCSVTLAGTRALSGFLKVLILKYAYTAV